MAEKNYISFDEFLNQNPELKIKPDRRKPTPIIVTKAGSSDSPRTTAPTVSPSASSGGVEKIASSGKRFDDDPDYVSRKRGKNRGGRSRTGSVPTPHIEGTAKVSGRGLTQGIFPGRPVPSGYFKPEKRKTKKRRD